jgi:G:T/U-mismatch repair DNA glycosylase
MGINPGLYSAYLGHHYCNANNHFWPCLYESGLIPKKLSFMEDAEVLNYGIGMSNIVPRTTRSASELSRKEIKEWSKVMIERMQELKPLIICFNGKGIYEIYTGGKCTVGVQEEPLPGTDIVVYVMPSTSGRAATYPKRSDKLKFFSELKDLRDRLHRREEGGRGEPSSNPAGSSNQEVAEGGGKLESSTVSSETSNLTGSADSSTSVTECGSKNCESPISKQSTGGQVSQRVPVIVSSRNNENDS